jgi:hypothetical protein
VELFVTPPEVETNLDGSGLLRIQKITPVPLTRHRGPPPYKIKRGLETERDPALTMPL